MAVAEAATGLAEREARALRDAYSTYLERTRGLSLTEYEAIEPWAWNQLRETLKSNGLTAKGAKRASKS